MTAALIVLGGLLIGVGVVMAADLLPPLSAGIRRRTGAQLPGTPGRAAARRSVSLSRRHRRILAGAALLGLALVPITHWVPVAVALPALVICVPAILHPSQEAQVIRRLEGLEEWVRSLAGTLQVGEGLEQAIPATAQHAPVAARDVIWALDRRLAAKMPLEEALRRFGEDVHDSTGDLITAALILGSRKRATGLGSVLEGLASTVAADVAMRRAIEADRSQPRANVRILAMLTGLVVVAGFFVPVSAAAYRTPLGQIAAVLLIVLFTAAAIWLQVASASSPLPRFLVDPPVKARRFARSLPAA